MHLIQVGTERTSISQAELHYVGGRWGWDCLWPHGERQISLRLNGHATAPNPAYVKLAEIALPHLQAIESISDTYLRGMVDVEDFYVGSWQIQSLQIGWGYPSLHEFGTEFDVTLAIRGDDYGEWRVGFVRQTVPRDVLSPYFFMRKQW